MHKDLSLRSRTCVFLAALPALCGLAFSGLVFASVPAAAQDLFTGARNSASIALGGSDLAAPHGALGAVASNPAGLAQIEGRSFEVGGLAIFGHGRYTSSSNTDSRLDPVLGAAPMAAFVTPVGSSPWRVSASATPDASLSADWTYTDAPGTAGATYGYQRNKSSLLNERFALGVGRPLGAKLNVGATVGLVYDSTTLIAPTIFQQQPVLKGLKTLLTLNTTGIGWNTSAAMIYSPARRLQLGVTYKSPTSLESTGDADGNLSALLAALQLTGAFRPDFHYAATLKNTLPQTVGVGLSWAASPRAQIFVRGDFVNWRDSFDHLALTVRDGNNADLNGMVGANTFRDVIPLDWRNQETLHVGFESLVRRNVVLRVGYVAGNDPVPSATLTPLTAAITRQSVAAGFGYHTGRYTIDAGYQAGLPTSASVEVSALQAGEYNNSTTELSTQTVSTTFRMSF